MSLSNSEDQYNPAEFLILETDGSTKRTNPGPSGWGYVALNYWEKEIYLDCGQLARPCTSNEAEYWAAIHALRFAKDLNYVRQIELRADSLTMIRQLEGKYGFRSPRLQSVSSKTLKLIEYFDKVELVWIPRRYNGQANYLAGTAAFAHNKNSAIRGISRSDYETTPPNYKHLGKE